MNKPDHTVPASASESTSPVHHSGPGEAPMLDRECGTRNDDWEEDPPRHARNGEEADVEAEPEPLDYYEIVDRHLRLLDKLVELTHPLATEYLTTAQEVSPDAPGRERIINIGCKLVSSTHHLIGTSARLRRID